MTVRVRSTAGPLAAVAGVALVALVVAGRDPDWSLVGRPGGRLAFEIAAALTLAVAGFVVRALGPVVVPSVAFLGVVVARYVHDLSRGFAAIDAVDRDLRLAEGAALLGIAAGVAW